MPSGTRTFLTVPVTGEGISSTDLSFCTSNKVSSSLIVSPALTNHLTISPSAIPSPISGNLNSNTPPSVPCVSVSAVGSAAGCSGVCSLAATPASPPLSSLSSCPGASISTNTSPTFATVPSGTRTFLTVPVTGEGISSTDLSFCTSNKVSSSLIVSPALTNHLTISPSAIPSPISGNLN